MARSATICYSVILMVLISVTGCSGQLAPAPSSGGPVPPPTPSVPPVHLSPPPPDGESGGAAPPPTGVTPEADSGGLKAGQKAGIAMGVIVAAGVVGMGGLVYKKRQENIRRSRFGSSTRRAQL